MYLLFKLKYVLFVFLNYNLLGIGFTFLNKSWHDRENPLIHISVFPPIDNKKKPKWSLCLKDATDLKCKNCSFIRFWSEKCKINFSKVHICDFSQLTSSKLK